MYSYKAFVRAYKKENIRLVITLLVQGVFYSVMFFCAAMFIYKLLELVG